MIWKSIIITGMMKLFLIIQEAYEKSYFKIIINKIWSGFLKLLDKSIIVKFLISEVGPEEGIEESLILNTHKKHNTHNKLILSIKKLIEVLVNNSLIIKNFIEKDMNFYILMLTIIAIPFVPTSLSLVLAGGNIILTLMINIYKGNKFKYPKFYLFGLLFFLVSIFISGILNFTAINSLDVFIIYLVFVGFAIFVPYIINTKEKLLFVLNSIVFVTILLGIYGIYQFIFGAPMDEAWVDKNTSSSLTRIYSTFGNPNVYGEYLVLVIPCIFALFHITENKIRKMFYLGVLVLSAGNVFLTMSRGSMLSLAIAILIIVVLKAHSYFPAVIIGGVIGALILPESIIRRILSIFTGGDTSTSYRMSIYQASINMLEDYAFTGTGLGQFRELYKIYSLTAAKSYHAHNTILMIFIEKGILGILSFITLIISWSRGILKTIKMGSDKLSFISISIFAAIAGCSIQGMVDHIWHNYDVMLMYFILLGLGCSASYLSNLRGNENE